MNSKSYKEYGWPSELSKDYLKVIYEGRIPRADNFLNKRNWIRLNRFTGPFKGNKLEVAAKLGRDLDAPLDKCFEDQLEKFVSETLEIHWNKEVPMTGGMIRVLKRMGRDGVLYRHGFYPKSLEQQHKETLKKINQLEFKIEICKKRLEKRVQFEEERNTKRQEARKNFESLDEEEQNSLRQDYDYAKTDSIIRKRGGKFEDFLIFMFKIKISLFEGIAKLNKVKNRLEEISANLKEVSLHLRKHRIDSTEFLKIYKPADNELNELECELKSLEAVF